MMSTREKKIILLSIHAVITLATVLCSTAFSDKPVAPALDVLYNFITPNYTPQKPGASCPGRDVMVCIMPDKFAPAFQPYAAWKHKSGTFIKIVKFSDIGASNKAVSCSTAIKPYIKNAYDKWTFRPTYIMLIGDGDVFPVKTYSVNNEGEYATDAFFGEVNNANGYEPDIMVGRLSVKDSAEMAMILKKIMQYERTPPIADTTWFKRGVALSDNETVDSLTPTLQAETVREASKIQMAAGFIVDTLMCTDNFKGDVSTVIQSINKGCSFINYRGQGWSEGWASACYYFSTAELHDVNNGAMLAFVTGIGCGIGMFNGNGGEIKESECFGEEWMRLGTAASPRGAVAVIGPAGNTHSYWNNEIDKAIYVGMFQKNLTTPGQALIAGINGMYKKTSLDKETTDYLARLFLVLGDPSVHIWKDVPKTATITHSASFPVGASSQTIIVKIGSQPVKNAQVCISGALGDSVSYVTGFTDTNGAVKLSLSAPSAPDSLWLVARGATIFPVEKRIPVAAAVAANHGGNRSSASFSLSVARQRIGSSAMTISFSLPHSGQTTVAVYSVMGALVRTLDCGIVQAGLHSTAWDGQNDNKATVARGVYFVSLQQAESIIRQRITKIE
jgi:hypothetical protein